MRLISWNREAAQKRAGVLRAAGFRVDFGPIAGPADLRQIGSKPPDVLVIDLDRQPSRGRDVALALRQTRATRFIPLVIAGGRGEDLARITRLLPDAAPATDARLRAVVRKVLAHPPAEPVVPPSALAGYAGTPLPKKLGIRPGTTVVLKGAPAGFERTLGTLPEGAVVRRKGRGEITIWFCRSGGELHRDCARRCGEAGEGYLWIVWAKKTSPQHSDIGQVEVRAAGLARGWVDFKVCAIDDTWSGLLFTMRGPGSAGKSGKSGGKGDRR